MNARNLVQKRLGEPSYALRNEVFYGADVQNEIGVLKCHAGVAHESGDTMSQSATFQLVSCQPEGHAFPAILESHRNV